MKISHSFSRLFLIAPVLACFALWPQMVAASGVPSNCNTSEGHQALSNVTTGFSDSAFGGSALFSDTTGSNNTATGCAALFNNDTGSHNTATGFGALRNNLADENTAFGSQALYSNTLGHRNTAVGRQALFTNTYGSSSDNTAVGFQALYSNVGGPANTAVGSGALFSNTAGLFNTADGADALGSNTTGQVNTATGVDALGSNTTGSHNIAVGYGAGYLLTTGDYNIDIGNPGVAAESNTIRIGERETQTATYVAGIFGGAVADGVPVIVDIHGHLGTGVSSVRFKDDIKPMDKASKAILALKPVTFRYKADEKHTAQFGLIAEEVAEANPDLVVRDKEGKPYAVRYDQVNAMLLNEFLKEHKKVEEQQATIGQLKSNAAKQEAAISELKKDMGVLTVQLQEQAAQMRKVSSQIELGKPELRTALNDQ